MSHRTASIVSSACNQLRPPSPNQDATQPGDSPLSDPTVDFHACLVCSLLLGFLKSFFSHASCFASFPLSCITICILLLFLLLLLYTMSFFLILYLSEPACTTSLFHTRPHDTCVIHKPKLSVIQTLNTLTGTQLS